MDELITAPAPAKRGVGIGVLIGVVVLAVAASSGVAFVLVQQMAPAAVAPSDGEAVEEEEEEEELAEPIFHSMEPAFIVNLADQDVMRYLQIEMQVMTRKQETIDKLVKMMPAVRNELLLVFGSKHYAELSGREGKEQLQAEALLRIESVLTGKPVSELAAAATEDKPAKGKKKSKKSKRSNGIEAVYFTSFVMQ